MAELDHTIVWCSDKQRSSHFLTDILGLPPARSFFQFLVVDLTNGVSLDFYQKDDGVSQQHYAFLVSDAEFDAAFESKPGLPNSRGRDPQSSQRPRRTRRR